MLMLTLGTLSSGNVKISKKVVPHMKLDRLFVSRPWLLLIIPMKIQGAKWI
jgi:hypothetical protein